MDLDLDLIVACHLHRGLQHPKATAHHRKELTPIKAPRPQPDSVEAQAMETGLNMGPPKDQDNLRAPHTMTYLIAMARRHLGMVTMLPFRRLVLPTICQILMRGRGIHPNILWI